MLECDRTDVSEESDINKTDGSRWVYYLPLLIILYWDKF